MMNSTVAFGVAPRKKPLFSAAAIRAAAIISVPLLFVVIAYLWPIAMMLFYSIKDSEVSDALPQTTLVLKNWDEQATPQGVAEQIVAKEITSAYRAETLARAATRMNRDLPGMHGLLMSTGRKLSHALDGGGELPKLTDVDERWEDVCYWREMKSAAGPLTAKYLLGALDISSQQDAEQQTGYHRIYIVRTFVIGIVVTICCVLVGVPLSCIIANAIEKVARLMLFCVLVPFWMSLLVRTSAWVMLLRQDGIVNKTLQALHLIDEPLRLICNRWGLYVAMIHILLPFLILPVFTVAKTIPKSHVQAAESLGASALASFFKVYLPQLMPGVIGGALFVFILSVGFYITPALIGGSQDQMFSYLIQQSAFTTANWGMASSIAVILLLSIAIFVTAAWFVVPKSWRTGTKH